MELQVEYVEYEQHARTAKGLPHQVFGDGMSQEHQHVFLWVACYRTIKCAFLLSFTETRKSNTLARSDPPAKPRTNI